MNQQIGKILIIAGVVSIVAGLLIYFFWDKLQWVGRLPGDISVEKPGMKIYFPVVTMILLSLLLNGILWLIRRFF